MKKSFDELVGRGDELLKGGNGLRKGFYGGRVTEWADQFHGTPLHIAALQCLKDRANCEKDMNAARAKHKGWRELEEMPKSERVATSKKQQQQMKPHHRRRNKIDNWTSSLEEKLLDHKMKEVKADNPTMGKVMTKSMDGKPVTDQIPEVQAPPEPSAADEQVSRLMDHDQIVGEGLPFSLRTNPADGEEMRKGDAPGVGLDPVPGAAYSSFNLDNYGVGSMNQPDGNGGPDEDEEPGEKYDSPEAVVTSLIPNSPMTYGSSR